MKKIALILTMILVLFCFTGCQDRFGRESKKEQVDIPISAEPVSIQSLEEEIKAVAGQYDPGGVLSQAMAIFDGKQQIQNQKGTISFTFCRNDEESGRGTTVIVKYDMTERKVTEVFYEQGNGKFKEAAMKPINDMVKAVPISELFDQMRNDSDYANKMNGKNVKVTMEFTDNIKLMVL